jgi:hypothetical protein
MNSRLLIPHPERQRLARLLDRALLGQRVAAAPPLLAQRLRPAARVGRADRPQRADADLAFLPLDHVAEGPEAAAGLVGLEVEAATIVQPDLPGPVAAAQDCIERLAGDAVQSLCH